MSSLEKLVQLLVASERAVVFTGAGISTESGIPDFRSPGGIWARYAPIYYQDFLSSPEARRETWERGLHTYPMLAAAEPNAGHRAIAELERLGKLVALITQNIDGLHQKAGNSPDLIVELHGNARWVRCLSCGERFERAEIHQRVEAGELEPPCRRCGGQLKPATVSFGEPLPPEAVLRAERAARQSDLFVVVGSSLVVYPAAGLPELALRAGAALAIVNASETHLDGYAAVRIEDKAGPALATVVEQLRRDFQAGRPAG